MPTHRRKTRRSAEDALDAQILGYTMANLRAAKGMSQELLAALSGVSRQSIFNIETGRVLPRWPTLMRLVRAMGVSGVELLAATDAAADDMSAVRVVAPSREEALQLALELAHGASRSLARCIALLRVVLSER